MKSRWGAAFVPPPATGTAFGDVDASNPFAPWIEELAREGFTGSCGNGNYSPNNPVTRAQMAVFLLKTHYGSAYVPPPGAGIFGDVTPCPGVFCDFIEDLYNQQITGGCTGPARCSIARPPPCSGNRWRGVPRQDVPASALRKLTRFGPKSR